MSLLIIYSVLSTLLIGVNIFLVKMMTLNNKYFFSILSAVVFTLLLSRICMYYAMKYTDNPINVHLILTLSVFVTLFLSLYFLDMKTFDRPKYISGIICIIIGIMLVKSSYA